MDSLEDDGFGAQNDATYLIRLFGAARFEFIAFQDLPKSNERRSPGFE